MRIMDLNYKEGLSRLAIILSIALVLFSIQLGERESYFLFLVALTWIIYFAIRFIVTGLMSR